MAEVSRSYAQSVLDNFRNKANAFQEKYNQLLKYEAAVKKDPRLYAEWKALRDRGITVRKTVESLKSKIESIVSWLRETFGVSLQGLGAVPLLPIIAIGAVVAGVALITKWLSDAYVFEQKMKQMQALIGQGVEPVKASEIVTKATQTQSIFEGLISSRTIGLIVLGLVVVNVLPKMLEGRE